VIARSPNGWRYSHGAKPVMYWRKGWWQISHFSEKHQCVINGRGKKPESCWNDYQRRIKWYAQGCPGRPRS
jgi:hypothetical protein